MSDEQTNQTDTAGTEDNNAVEKSKEDPSTVEKVNKNYEELKEANDKVEKELLRGEELKAKANLGGRTMAGNPQLTPKEEIEKKGAEEAQEIVDAFR